MRAFPPAEDLAPARGPQQRASSSRKINIRGGRDLKYDKVDRAVVVHPFQHFPLHVLSVEVKQPRLHAIAPKPVQVQAPDNA